MDGRRRRRNVAWWHGSWLLALVALVACSGPAWPSSPDPAATATRAAEVAQLTEVAGTIEGFQRTPTPGATARVVATPAAASATTTPSGALPRPIIPPTATPIRTTVRTPAPPATVTPTPTVTGGAGATTIPLVANDLVYDPRSQRLYASVPGRVGPQGNSLVAIDPLTGAVGTPVPLGSEPGRLALSDDGRYLYAALDGAGAIRRFDISQGAADLTIGLTGGPDSGPCTPSDVEVVPGLAEIVAVAQDCKFPGQGTGIAAYSGTTALPSAAQNEPPGGDTVFCGPDRTLYGYARTRSLHVDGAGIAIAGKQNFALTTNGMVHQLRCDGDRLYGSGGEVIDVRTGARAGIYAGLDFNALVCPDATVGRTFFVDLIYGPTPRFYVYDQARFTLLAKVDLPAIPKPASSPYMPPSRLVRWGDDGLAFLSGERLVLLRSPLVSGAAAATPTTGSPTPTIARPPTPTPVPTRTPSVSVPGTKVALATNDIVYDPGTKKIYASVPGIGGPNGNSIVPIDPTTGALGPPIFVGSEPSKLALSDDGKYLYVALSGASAVRRVDLAEQKAELQFDIGSDPQFGPYLPGDIAVMPGHADTVAVVLYGPNGSRRTVALFVNGVKRPVMPAYPVSSKIGAIEFCSSPAALYGFNTGDTGADFHWLTVDADGITAEASQREMFGPFGDIVCDHERIYANSGEVLDPVARRQVGRCPVTGRVRPDSTLGRIFYLTDSLRDGTDNTQRVVICDQQRFTLLGAFEVPAFPQGNFQHGFIRWGADGLAYRGGPGELFLVQSPLVRGQP